MSDNTRRSFDDKWLRNERLAFEETLREDGELHRWILNRYVHKRKAPAREFVDDYLRERIASLCYDDAVKVCREITELGHALSESKAKVSVPAVPALGIEAGEYDIQRFVYHFFVKCYWNPNMSFQENVVFNYDWYHPTLASRHTAEEVENWFVSAGMKINHRCVDFYGITMRGTQS